MRQVPEPLKKDVVISPTMDQKKDIENHKTAAEHHQQAAKSHLEAAKHHEEGNHEKAAHSTIEAHGHNAIAMEAQKEDSKHHALQSKK